MKRIEFRLSMPSRASWNGGWSGEGRNYAIVKTLTDKRAAQVMANGPTFYHAWSDGWGALITARIVPTGERLPKSDGFCGYGWMVDNILTYGSPYTTGEFAGAATRGAS